MKTDNPPLREQHALDVREPETGATGVASLDREAYGFPPRSMRPRQVRASLGRTGRNTLLPDEIECRLAHGQRRQRLIQVTRRPVSPG